MTITGRLSQEEFAHRQWTTSLMAIHISTIAAGPTANEDHKKIEALRAEHASPKDPFGLNATLAAAITEAGL